MLCLSSTSILLIFTAQLSLYSVISLSAHDDNAWYYPSHGYDSDDEIRFSAARGNWGRKTVKDAKWVRRGKMAAWAPAREEWEVRSSFALQPTSLGPECHRLRSVPVSASNSYFNNSQSHLDRLFCPI